MVTLTHKLHEAESLAATAENENCHELSVPVEDDNAGSDPEDDEDADTIEEEPDFSSTGEMLTESEEDTETEDEEDTNGRRYILL